MHMSRIPTGRARPRRRHATRSPRRIRPKPITVSGSIGLVSDYRFRGVSQSDKEMAVQGGATITHESGFYGAFWGSNLSGWGTFGGANMELDLVAGYKRSLGSGLTVDAGLTWYMYPGGYSNTDFAEPYVKLSGTVGPVSLLGGVAYAPKQEALGNWSNTPREQRRRQARTISTSGAMPAPASPTRR